MLIYNLSQECRLGRIDVSGFRIVDRTAQETKTTVNVASDAFCHGLKAQDNSFIDSLLSIVIPGLFPPVNRQDAKLMSATEWSRRLGTLAPVIRSGVIVGLGRRQQRK